MSEIKASVLYACGLNPNPVVEIDRITTIKNSQGQFMPAVRTQATLANNQEYTVKFPVFCFDITTDKGFEDARRLFHERLDRTFDEYKTKWTQMQENSAQAQLKEAAAEEPSELDS